MVRSSYGLQLQIFPQLVSSSCSGFLAFRFEVYKRLQVRQQQKNSHVIGRSLPDIVV